MSDAAPFATEPQSPRHLRFWAWQRNAAPVPGGRAPDDPQQRGQAEKPAADRAANPVDGCVRMLYVWHLVIMGIHHGQARDSPSWGMELLVNDIELLLATICKLCNHKRTIGCIAKCRARRVKEGSQ